MKRGKVIRAGCERASAILKKMLRLYSADLPFALLRAFSGLCPYLAIIIPLVYRSLIQHETLNLFSDTLDSGYPRLFRAASRPTADMKPRVLDKRLGSIESLGISNASITRDSYGLDDQSAIILCYFID